MIDLSIVIDRIEDETKFSAQASRDRELNLQELTALPAIYVGYSDIMSRYPKDAIEEDFLDTHGEDLVQLFSVNIVELPEELSTTWKTVYKALQSFSPTVVMSSGATVSNFYYSQGGVIGLSNGKIWWMDRWIIKFPSTNVSF